METATQPQSDRVSTARLVAAAKAGDEGAFERLIDRYRPGLHALCFDRTGDFHTAEDLAQDAVLRAHQHLHTLSDDHAFAAWLRRIALNCCRAWQQRPWPETVEIDPENCPQPTQDVLFEAMRRDAAREVRAAIAKLPENNRIALLMHYIRANSYREIAEFLGVPETTVVGRLHRARGRLRSLLEERRIREHLEGFSR
jgi:RNA polymerase sigma-70 factor (ECF subfamily)